MGRQKNSILSKPLCYLSGSGCNTSQQQLRTCWGEQLPAITLMGVYKVKAKPPIFLHFPTHSISKERLGNSAFWDKFYFFAAQIYRLQIYYWLTAAWGEIPGFIYVHRCFWKVYFLYFVLPANLIYHLLPWKHGLLLPSPSKMAIFQFSLCCSASLTNPCSLSAPEHGAHLEYSAVH